MSARLPSLLLTVGLAVGQAGCVQITAGSQGVGFVCERSVTWTWGDWNTLRRPAWFVERIEHLPPQADRVRYYRWLHGAGVADPLAPPLPPPPGVETISSGGSGAAIILEPTLAPEELPPEPAFESVPLPAETPPLSPAVMSVPELPPIVPLIEDENSL